MAEPYPYIYVTADGGARELHASERAYLETPFQGGDGARPYIKDSYAQKNGWGEIKGFMKRAALPKDTMINPAPSEDPSAPMGRDEQLQFLRDKGMDVTDNGDGTFTVRKPKTKV